MPFYCLYYYKQAQQLKPNDSRMIIALGETYERLDRTENALKCYYKACTMGDIEGSALTKLAKYAYIVFIFIIFLRLLFVDCMIN